MLSSTLLATLREYWKAYRPSDLALPRPRTRRSSSPPRTVANILSVGRPPPPGWPVRSRRTRCATPSRRTCWKPARTFARSRRCSGTAACALTALYTYVSLDKVAATTSPLDLFGRAGQRLTRRPEGRRRHDHPRSGGGRRLAGPTARRTWESSGTSSSSEQRRVLRDLVRCRTANWAGMWRSVIAVATGASPTTPALQPPLPQVSGGGARPLAGGARRRALLPRGILPHRRDAPRRDRPPRLAEPRVSSPARFSAPGGGDVVAGRCRPGPPRGRDRLPVGIAHLGAEPPPCTHTSIHRRAGRRPQRPAGTAGPPVGRGSSYP